MPAGWSARARCWPGTAGWSPASGLLCREMGTCRTSRVHRPDAHLQRTAPAIGTGRVCRPLPRPPPAPVPPATTTRPRRPGEPAAGPTGPAAEGARRRDQRVLPRGVADLMNTRSDVIRLVLKRYTRARPRRHTRLPAAGTQTTGQRPRAAFPERPVSMFDSAPPVVSARLDGPGWRVTR